MRILIFGAGASKPAGYPLTSEIPSALEEFVRVESEGMLRAYWHRWTSWRDSQEGIIKELLSSPNPEVVLSVPDLYETAVNSSNLEQLRRAHAKLEAGELTKEDLRKYEEHFKKEEHKRLLEGRHALVGFIECLLRFFLYKHHCDFNDRPSRDYLRRHFANLSKDDVIITLNWDTTAERTLAEEGAWNPISGYGFHKDLRVMPDLHSLPSSLSVESQVKVLKLHGSVGWHSSGPEDLHFDHPRFLSQFQFWSGGNPLDLADPQAPRNLPPEGPVLLYPSFLKQLNGRLIQQIWHTAGESLRKAATVDVYGYSLPESDSAVRILLNVLRFRLESGEIHVRIHDPSGDAQDRWRGFLGKEADIDGRRIEDVPLATNH